jgi:hypothetical protein
MGREASLAFVVKIGKMNEARALPVLQTQISYPKQRGLDPFGVDSGRGRERQEAERQKLSASDHTGWLGQHKTFSRARLLNLGLC